MNKMSEKRKLPNIEQFLSDGRMTVGNNKRIQEEFDISGYIRYVKEKYNGDSSKVSQKELVQFLKDDKRHKKVS